MRVACLCINGCSGRQEACKKEGSSWTNLDSNNYAECDFNTNADVISDPDSGRLAVVVGSLVDKFGGY